MWSFMHSTNKNKITKREQIYKCQYNDTKTKCVRKWFVSPK